MTTKTSFPFITFTQETLFGVGQEIIISKERAIESLEAQLLNHRSVTPYVTLHFARFIFNENSLT